MEIIRGRVYAPRRILVYGPHGIGKSTFGSMASRPIFLPTEEGVNDLDVDKFPLLSNMLSVRSAVSKLQNEDLGYQTVVVDTLDWLERIFFSEVCGEKGVNAIEEIPYGKGPGLAIQHWDWFLEQMNDLRMRLGMQIILIAHAKIEKFANPETDTYDRYSPDLHKSSAPMLQEWCDEVLFCNYRTFTKSNDAGFGRTEVKAVGTGERVIKTIEGPSHVAKNRLGLPVELPLDYRAYSEYLPQREAIEAAA